MQNATLLAMAGLFALQSATGAVGQEIKRHAVHLPQHEARTAYTVQTVSVRAGCFPERLRAIFRLSTFGTKARRMGKVLRVMHTSVNYYTYRDREVQTMSF